MTWKRQTREQFSALFLPTEKAVDWRVGVGGVQGPQLVLIILINMLQYK